MRRAGIAVVAVLFALAARGQTRIASDVEIREMEEAVRRGADFETRVSARINLGTLRDERNEFAAAQREFQAALQLTREEQDRARRARDLPHYAAACSWAGVALAGLHHGREAFAILEEAVRYAPDSPAVWNHYSVAMFRLAKPEKAIGAARMSVAAAERKTAQRATVRELLDLNVDRFALAQGLLDSRKLVAEQEAEQILRRITESLDSDDFKSLRKAVGKREEFQLFTAPATESGMYLTLFHRAHIRLAGLYESSGMVDEARREYQAVISRRSDEPGALAGLARLTSDAKERDRYLVQSLDANPFASEVVDDYERHVQTGDASPAAEGGSVGSRVRLAIQQIHDRDFRRARSTLDALLNAHPHNDVLHSLVARAALQSGDVAAARIAMASVGDAELRADVERRLRNAASARPWFLDRPVTLVTNPSEADLRAVLLLFAGNQLSPVDRAALDQREFSSRALFDAPDGDALERGTIRNVPFRLQNPAPLEGISAIAGPLRVTYRILGATTVNGRDALLVELVRAEVEK